MRKCIIAVLAAVTFASCASKKTDNYVDIDGFALGTTFHFVINEPDTTGIYTDIEQLFDELDYSMSVYRPGSLINRLNANETDSVDRHIAYNVELAKRFSEMSGGMYDVTIKPVTEAIGFAGMNASANPDIDSLLQFVGYDKISVENGRLAKEHPAMQLDLNSIAKGYIVDIFGQYMESRGVEDYLVEIGGEIVCKGFNREGKEWLLGIDKPFDGNMIPGRNVEAMVRVTNAGLATSGDYRKFYYDQNGRKVAHIVNALTGQSETTDLLSVTVIAENCATADAAATMFKTVGRERAIDILEQNPQWMALLIYDDGKGGLARHVTKNLKEKIVE